MKVIQNVSVCEREREREGERAREGERERERKVVKIMIYMCIILKSCIVNMERE